MRKQEMSDHNDTGFHKGLFYGVLLGVGLIWFLGTKEGKKIKEEVLSKGEDLLTQASETIEATLEEIPEKSQE